MKTQGGRNTEDRHSILIPPLTGCQLILKLYQHSLTGQLVPSVLLYEPGGIMRSPKHVPPLKLQQQQQQQQC
jgi:hypothetical protein